MHDDCPHDNTEVRYKQFSDGSKHLCTQCLKCGKRIGTNWLSAQGVVMDAILPFDEKLYEAYEHGMRERAIARRQSQRVERHLHYEQWLQGSEDWQHTRRKVLQRDKYLCQACLEQSATQVHHTSYVWIYEEVMYDLVSVCDACHRKVHHKL